MRPTRFLLASSLVLAGFCARGVADPSARLGAAAPDRDAKDQSARAQDALELPDATRVLHVRGSGVIRARSRRSAAGLWEVARDGRWIELTGLEIERWALEDELLDDHAERSAELGNPMLDVHRRLELARWCEANGLLVEFARHLDAALEACPGDEMVERFVDRAADRITFGVELPSAEELALADDRARVRAIEAALRTLSRLSPSARRIASATLVERAGWEHVAAVVHEDLRRSGPLGRRLASELVGRFAPATDTKVLLVRAVLDADEDVRIAASVALGRADQPALVLPVERALASSNPMVQMNAAAALGHMGYQQALLPIASAIRAPAANGGGGGGGTRGHVFIGRQLAYVQDFDVEVAGASNIADPQIGVLVEGSVLDVRVLATRIERRRVIRVLASSASRLLRRDIGERREDWERWAANYRPPTSEGPATPSGSGPDRPDSGDPESEGADPDGAEGTNARRLPTRAEAGAAQALSVFGPKRLATKP